MTDLASSRTALAAGTHTLSVTFTPTNTSGFASVTTTVKIVVTKAVLTVEANDLTMTKGGTVPKLTTTYTGFVNGDTAVKALTGAPALTTTAKSTSAAGIYPITVKQGTLAAANYSFTFLNGNLLVTSGTVTKHPAAVLNGAPPR